MLEDADVTVIVDYATVVPPRRLIFGDDEEARRTGDKLAEEAMRSGKMKLDYTQAEMPAAFNDLHDALAKITA